MAVSTPTVADVRLVITTAQSDGVVQSAIDDAALMAEHCLTSLTEGRQKAIIKWLAAHLLFSMTGSAGAPKNLTQSSLGDASESYGKATLGEGLKGTTYGQQAIALDPNGCVANIGKTKACFKVL